MIKNALLSRLSKIADFTSAPIGYEHARSVGILTIFEQSEGLDELVLQLQNEGKSPRIISLITNPIKNQSYPENTFTAKDISLTGTIKSTEVLYFTKQKFDFLLSLDHSGNKIIKYLLTKTHANHRVGIYHPNFSKILDMMIIPRATTSFVPDVLKYLKMIKND